MQEMHECVLYDKAENKAVKCKACAHRCTIQNGKTGICGIRGNIDGKLYLFVYGRPSAVNIDPIEKKPFFHFHPKTRAYSIGTFGCNFRCKFCFSSETTAANDGSVYTLEELFENSEFIINQEDGWVGKPRKNETFSHIGKRRRILKFFKHSYKGPLIRIKPYYVPEIKTTPYHEFFIYENGELKKVAASELKKSSFLVIPKIKPKGKRIIINTKRVLNKINRFFKVRVKYTDKDIEKIKQLKNKGYSSKMIGRMLGIHPVYIRKLLNPKTKITNKHRIVAISKDGYTKFKGEKGRGIPAKIKLNEELAELLGYYCCEGHITEAPQRPNSGCTVFSFGKHEKQLISRTARLIEKIFKTKPKIIERRTTTTVEVSGSSISTFFSILCGKRSSEKVVPSLLSKSNKKSIAAYIKAVVKGDGTVVKDAIAISTVSKKFAFGMYYLFLLAGYMPGFYIWKPKRTKKIEKRIVNQKTLYYVKLYSEKQRKKFLGMKYCYNKRSEENIKYKEMDGFWLVPIREIGMEYYSGYVYNMEVEGEHSYLANFVAVGNCQNWDLSQFPKAIAYGQGAEAARKVVEERSIPLPPEKAVSEAMEYGCEGMAYTYNEPTIFSEYAVDTAKIAKEKGLYNVYVSNGFITKEAIEYADRWIDAFNIDIKGDDRFYRELSGARLEPVLESIKELKKRKKWVEVTTLIVPGWNDSEEFLRWVAKWIADLDRGMPWHVTRFYPAYQMMDVPPTEEKTLLRAWEIGKEEGLNYVYVGNISAGEKENTYCPKCKFLLVERRWFDVVRNNIKNGKCPECGRKVEGVWD